MAVHVPYMCRTCTVGQRLDEIAHRPPRVTSHPYQLPSVAVLQMDYLLSGVHRLRRGFLVKSDVFYEGVTTEVLVLRNRTAFRVSQTVAPAFAAIRATPACSV